MSIMLVRCSLEREVSKYVEEDRYKEIKKSCLNKSVIDTTDWFLLFSCSPIPFYVSRLFAVLYLKSSI